MTQSAKVLYSLMLFALFSAGLLLAKYAPWAEPDNTAMHGSLGGDFVLNSHTGEVALEDFRGQLVLMYFGFTSCPDVCPTALSTIAASMRQLDGHLESQIQPLFVSVDPARDTLDNLAQYSAYFHPKMLGLTGTTEYLDTLVKNYGAYYRHIPLENSALGYTVDHTSRVYLIGREGQLISTIAHGTPVDEVTALLKLQL
ncbi:MAG: SCO family protein [Gammaproteobacteria bacterium]|nr:SCO family protein [Gammaproteobacteria bacterium]